MSDLPNHVGERRRTTMAARMETFDKPQKVRAIKSALVAEPVWLDRLCEACTDPDDGAIRIVLADMREAGFSPVSIAEIYVPEAARILGDAWCEDEQSFAFVTIGCSRLHGILRELDPHCRPAAPNDIHAPSVLVVVAEDIYHTLGATVLTGMLRRRGYNVRLWLGAKPAEMEAALLDCDYQSVLISASSGESLETLRRIVKSVKNALTEPPKVILGGTVVADGAISSADALALTGADYVTNDPAEAIALCGQAKQSRDGSNITSADQHRRG